MKFSFQHLAPRSGHESTLFRFEHDGQTDCVLVDSGSGVDLDGYLGDDEYLSAVLLTHGHIDHYRTLGRNLRHQAPVYASPGTAAVLEQALPAAAEDNDVGDVDAVMDALTPVEAWTSLVDGPDVSVKPVPAGHAPGAAGFLVRIDDDPLDVPHRVLVTGDFTTRPCAGYPGLSTEVGELKAAFVNAATDDTFPEDVTASVGTVLERAFAGGRVVVATGGLTGVHYAYLLGRAAAVLDRELPVYVVGQAAKLYGSLEYDVPNVTAVPVFDRPDEVLDPGAVTIAGPETPTGGSTGRLLDAVRDDPAAAFVQVTTSGADEVARATCSTARFETSNHPSPETLDDVITSLDPENVVVQHTRSVERYRDRYPSSFVWATDSSRPYTLYVDGEWIRPDWMSDRAVREIEMARYGDDATAGDGDGVPAVGRRDTTLAAEGLNVDALRESFVVDVGAAQDDEAAVTDGSTGGADTVAASGASGGEATHDASDAALRSTVLERLDAIERALAADETVAARVLRGDGVTLLQLLDDDSALDDGDVVQVAIEHDGAGDSG